MSFVDYGRVRARSEGVARQAHLQIVIRLIDLVFDLADGPLFQEEY